MEGLYTGTLAEGISTTMYNGKQGYDKNGNIGYLKRTTGGGATVMDELIYSYTANQLTAVADGGDATKGFKDKVNAIDYTYDQAGNMITDANKDLSIAYNHLNLPASITRNTPVTPSVAEGSNGIVKHFYAGATKVRMETYDAAGNTLVKAYDYLAGMVYQETVTAGTSTKELDFVASPEGRALLTKKVLNLTADPTTGDKFKFEYSLKDHLGNLRVSCRCGEPKRDAQGVIIPEGTAGAGIEPLAVVQEQHYDAWGLAFTQPAGTGLEDRFKYNGKELLTDLDLGWNEYGARMYMSEIGRWNGVDALLEKFTSFSPYNYCLNSPILLLDPDGMKSVWNGSGYIDDQTGESRTWDEVQQEYGFGNYSSSYSVVLSAKSKKIDRGIYDDGNINTEGALSQLLSFALSAQNENNSLRVLQVDNSEDAFNQLNGLTAKVNNIIIFSHGNAENAEFKIGAEKFKNPYQITNSASLAKIANLLTIDAEIIIYACHIGSTNNGGVSLLNAMSSTLKRTVYGNRSWGLAVDIFSGASPSMKPNTVPVGRDVKQYDYSIKNNGIWTRAMYDPIFNAVQTSAIRNVFFDSFGKIRYEQN